ncbi:Metallo-dependent phosphatase [Botryosphaeria dothidea]|uniref:Metallo-dependent phosphatase n=1 Tax=Botryosphaeria dothidea TaxID=55169 RepID=A0A8H4IY05_9PEZI|nr:Metallo-dependent phosphatase [Botryosphaeria dothidea]
MLRRLLFGDDSPFEPSSIVVLFLRAPLKCLVYFVYRVLNALRSAPPPGRPSVRVVCMSDTHTLTHDIPDGDILIHAGDLGNAGTVSELQAQIDWLDSLPHPHKIVVAGNHDTYLDPRSRRTLAEPDRNRELHWKSIHYLQHNSLLVRVPNSQRDPRTARPSSPRALRIYGAPQIPACGGPEFAFQYPRGRDAWTDTIPRDIDILVTHTPPKYHRDLPLPDGMGCEHLMREVWRIRPLLHVFGHVHVGAGKEVNWWDDGQRAYERALARPVTGLTRGLLSIPTWVDLALVLFWGVRGVIWDRIWGGEVRGTVLVNAGLMVGNSGRLGNRVQVVEI